LLAKYFGTGQRKQKTIDMQVRYSWPRGFQQLDGLTQVASCHRLLQTSMLHYFLMERYYWNAAIDNDMFTGLWDANTQDDWVLVKAIESQTFMLAIYALGKSQVDKVAASQSIHFRKICEKYIKLNNVKF
jgi:hypothetical protein